MPIVATPRTTVSRPWKPVGAVVVALVLLASCTSSSDAPAAPDDGRKLPAGAAPTIATDGPEPTPIRSLEGAKARATLIGRAGSIPTAIVATPDGRELLVTEVTGKVRRFRIDRTDGHDVPRLQRKAVLDLSSVTHFDGQNRGLLGLAITRDGRHLITSFNTDDGAVTLRTFPYRRGATLRPSDGTTIVSVPHPISGLGGGNITLDRNGDLLLGIGDMDQKYWHPPAAQDPKLLLGAIVRIPRARTTGAARSGTPTLVAKGIRNPWGIGVDQANGDIWFGDVGGGITEEINRIPGRAKGTINFGWPYYDGNEPRKADLKTGTRVLPPDGFTFTKAVITRTHAIDVCGAVGGVVLRGRALPELSGVALYGDLCSSAVRALIMRGGRVVADEQVASLGDEFVIQYAQAPNGTTYVLGLDGGVFRLDPAAWRAPAVKAPAPKDGFVYPERGGTPSADRPEPVRAMCAILDSFGELDGIPVLTPAQLQERLVRAAGRIDAAVERAPADLRDDVVELGRVFNDLRDQGEASAWKADDPVFSALLDDATHGRPPYERFNSALNNLIDYLSGCSSKYHF